MHHGITHILDGREGSVREASGRRQEGIREVAGTGCVTPASGCVRLRQG